MRHMKALLPCLLVVATLAVAGAVMTLADTIPTQQPAPQAFEAPSEIRVSQVLTPAAYLPLVTRGYFIAFDYFDGFSDVSSGWPYGSSPFGYGYLTDSDGSKTYFLRVDKEYEMGWVTAPTFAPGNFDLEVAGRRINLPKYWYDEYGIFISPTPIDPQNPSGSGVYTLIIQLKVGDQPSYAVHKWNALNRSSRTQLVKQVETVYITQVAKAWNYFRIKRRGDTIEFWVARQNQSGEELAYSFTDSNLPDTLYVGVYAQHSKDDMGDYTIEFQYDYVDLSTWP